MKLNNIMMYVLKRSFVQYSIATVRLVYRQRKTFQAKKNFPDKEKLSYVYKM